MSFFEISGHCCSLINSFSNFSLVQKYFTTSSLYSPKIWFYIILTSFYQVPTFFSSEFLRMFFEKIYLIFFLELGVTTLGFLFCYESDSYSFLGTWEDYFFNRGFSSFISRLNYSGRGLLPDSSLISCLEVKRRSVFLAAKFLYLNLFRSSKGLQIKKSSSRDAPTLIS